MRSLSDAPIPRHGGKSAEAYVVTARAAREIGQHEGCLRSEKANAHAVEELDGDEAKAIVRERVEGATDWWGRECRKEDWLASQLSQACSS